MAEQIIDWDQRMVEVTTGSELSVAGSVLITDGIVAGQVRLDGSTESLNVVNYDHHEIHDGRHFTLSNCKTIASGANFDLGVTTGTGSRLMHVLFLTDTQSLSEIQVFEHASFSGGTSATPINRNRSKLNASDHTFVEDPTVTDTGSIMFRACVGNRTVAGAVRSLNEYVLNSGLKYLFRIQSAAANNVVSGRLEWYEHTDLN